jgi:hypothetical protein
MMICSGKINFFSPSLPAGRRRAGAKDYILEEMESVCGLDLSPGKARSSEMPLIMGIVYFD